LEGVGKHIGGSNSLPDVGFLSLSLSLSLSEEEEEEDSWGEEDNLFKAIAMSEVDAGRDRAIPAAVTL
jgi:hypothetical protein